MGHFFSFRFFESDIENFDDHFNTIIKIMDNFQFYIKSKKQNPIFAGNDNDTLYGLSVDGDIMYEFLATDRIRTSPAFYEYGNDVSIFSGNNCIRFFEESGLPLWKIFPHVVDCLELKSEQSTVGDLLVLPMMNIWGEILFGGSEFYIFQKISLFTPKKFLIPIRFD